MVEVKHGRYAMYLRKSRADLEKERRERFDTLAKHERELAAMCQRDGIAVDYVFRELVSGESISERHEFQRLMEMVTSKALDGVVVHAIDRLGRGDMMEYGYVLSAFQWTRTKIVTPGKTYDPNDRTDFMALQMQMIIANGELSAYKERMRAGREQSVRDGQYIGSHAPYGYDKAVVSRMRTLRPNGQAAIVRDMFGMMLESGSFVRVCNALNARGIPGPTGGTWTPNAVKRIIRNPTYMGKVRWNDRVRTIESRDGLSFVRRRVPNPEPMVCDGLHPAIVTEDVWRKANAAHVRGSSEHTGKPLRNPFAGILVCEKCGSAMTLVVSDPHGRRQERLKHRQYSDCTTKSCSLDMVMDAVVDALKGLYEDIEYEVSIGTDAAQRVADEVAALRSELAAARRRSDRLVELFTADAIGIQEFRDRREPIERQMERMESRIAELEGMEVPDQGTRLVRLHEGIEMLRDPSVDARRKNDCLKEIIERITYRNDGTSRNQHDIHLDIFLM